MSSFFTDSQKVGVRSLFESLHETFSSDVNVYIEESVSTGVSTDYNSIYRRYKDESKGASDKVLTKYTIQARVHFFKKSEEAVLDNIGLPSSANVVRLKVDQEGLNLLNKSSFVEINGNKCQLISNPEGIGPFFDRESLYYKVFLRVDT